METTTEELAAAQRWVQALLTRRQGDPATQLPFSFAYGGQPSAALLQVWNREAAESELGDRATEQTLTFTDPESSLQVRCVSTIYRDFPAIEWVLYLKNAGGADTAIVEDLQPLDATFECPQGRCVVHHANGSLCSLDDFAPLARTLNPRSELCLQPGGGRSSSEVLPFFNVETTGEGVVMAVGWTGEWRATFARDENDRLRVRAGMAHTHFRLHPGEEVRSPRILLLFWQGNRLRGHNLLRRFILAHHRPSVDGQPLVAPTCAGNWGGTPAALHLDNV